MPRPPIKIEMFHPKSHWPVRLYDSFTQAEKAGHVRKSIYRCIKNPTWTHHRHGWRIADAVSHIGEFLDLMVEEDDGLHREAWLRLSDLINEFGLWVMKRFSTQVSSMHQYDSRRLQYMVKNHFRTEEIVVDRIIDRYGSRPPLEIKDTAVPTLTWIDWAKVRRNRERLNEEVAHRIFQK